jgi:hypothetical protein
MIVEAAGGVVINRAGSSIGFNQPDPFFRGLVASNEKLSTDIQGLMNMDLQDRT